MNGSQNNLICRFESDYIAYLYINSLTHSNGIVILAKNKNAAQSQEGNLMETGAFL